jgi:hypothetical protein
MHRLLRLASAMSNRFPPGTSKSVGGWPRVFGARAMSPKARSALDTVSTELGLPEIVSFAVHDNRRSIAVMERIGMKRDPTSMTSTHPKRSRHASPAQAPYRLPDATAMIGKEKRAVADRPFRFCILDFRAQSIRIVTNRNSPVFDASINSALRRLSSFSLSIASVTSCGVDTVSCAISTITSPASIPFSPAAESGSTS